MGFWKNSLVIFALLCAGSLRAELWVPSVFSKCAVLQRDLPVPVWGKADPGAKITVEFAGQKKTAVADSSKHWKIMLDPMSASSKPRKLIIHSSIGNQKSEINNVLVGDVWVLSGQSNMALPLGKVSRDWKKFGDDDLSWLRYFKQSPRGGACDAPADDVCDGAWIPAAANSINWFSAVGFFFARSLHPYLDGVPVALLDTSMGGTYAECWIDFQTLEKTPAARPYLNRAAREVVPGQSNPKGYFGVDNFRRPAALYNGKVAPVQPFAVRGVIWYQGEGNSQKWLAEGYAETLTALVNSWRRDWHLPELPFLIVQLPKYDAGKNNDWPAVRAAQAAVAETLENTELAVTIDCGEKDQIHPVDKQPVGERLALLARAKVYGENVACSGPVFQTLEKTDGALRITFDFSDGLYFEGSAADGFEICGPAGTFFPAQAEVVSDGCVRVFHPDIPNPVAVRYGWFNWGRAGLYNQAGLPAAPFWERL